MRIDFTKDAQAALGFVTSQTSYIEREVNETVYPDIQYPGLIPVDTSANPWAKSVTYYSADKYGKADWINGNADDIPIAGTEMAKHETQVHMAGIGYGYGLEELNQAQMLGYNLQASDAMAARRAYEEMVDRVAFIGDASKGFSGLFDFPGVTVDAADNGDWANESVIHILDDFNQALIGQFTGTNFTSMADTVLMPYSRYLKLASRPISEDFPNDTVLQYLMRANAYTAQTGRPLTIRALRGLDTAGSSGTARMVTYRRDPQVLKMHIPMPHRFLPVYQSGPIRWDVPGIFRLGGLDIRRPKEVLYTDGI